MLYSTQDNSIYSLITLNLPITYFTGSEDSAKTLFNINDDSDKDKSYTVVRNEFSPSSDEDNGLVNNSITLKSKLNVETPQFKQSKKTTTEVTSEISGTANKKLKIFHPNISTNSIHQSSTPEVPTNKISACTSSISPSIELESDKGKINFNGFTAIFIYT